MSNVPSNLKYAASHEWVLKNADGSVTIGITDHAQEALGDLVFVELPEVGAHYAADKEIAVVESVKAAADLCMPVGGEIVEVNEALRANPSLANTDPMGEGWFFKVRIADMTEYDQLMDVPAYDALLKTL